MELMLERIMGSYGSELVWIHEGMEETIRGFLQPVTNRSWQKLLRQMTALGEASTGLYVYFGPVSVEIQPGQQLRQGMRTYQVRKTELIYDHTGPVYCWALCARKGA